MVFFSSFLKCHIIFQNESGDYKGEDDIIDIIEVDIIYFISLQYVILCSKKLHSRKYENVFYFALWIFILKNTEAHFGKNATII